VNTKALVGVAWSPEQIALTAVKILVGRACLRTYSERLLAVTEFVSSTTSTQEHHCGHTAQRDCSSEPHAVTIPSGPAALRRPSEEKVNNADIGEQ
jgi:hypothetical protein